MPEALPPPDALIDWKQLDTIAVECGEEIGEIFLDFIADFDAQSARIRELLAQGDLVAAGKAAHQLKGSSSTFGMRYFAQLAKRIELDAVERNVAPTAGEVAEFEAVFRESVRLIRQERGQFRKS